jgi:hypothetical protein
VVFVTTPDGRRYCGKTLALVIPLGDPRTQIVPARPRQHPDADVRRDTMT